MGVHNALKEARSNSARRSVFGGGTARHICGIEMPQRFVVEVAPSQVVTVIDYAAPTERRAGITLILGHGAGADQTSGFMVSFATELAARGIDIVTFNFLYSEDGRRIPDPNARLKACYRATINTVRDRRISRSDGLAIGGKSMGGRIASQVAAASADDLAGLVVLGYPLHPPGRKDRLRASHLPQVKAPMLFIQGSRDAFGTPDELQPIINQLQPPANLYVVEGGDHSLKVLKRFGVTQEDVYRAVQDEIEAWLRRAVVKS